MIHSHELDAAQREAELKRIEFESVVGRLETRVQAVSATAHKVMNYGREAERLSRDFPFVNLAIFLSAGFILGSFFSAELNKEKVSPEIIPEEDLLGRPESGVVSTRLAAN